MKSSSIFVLLGLAATAFSATVNLTTEEAVEAEAIGSVVAAAAADTESGAAGGSVDGDGTVIAAATIGAALGLAMSSPSL